MVQRREPLRRKLEALLADDRPEPRGLLEALRELGRAEGVRACAEALRLLVHIDQPEEKADRLLGDLLVHRADLGKRLGRDPGLRVAALDYLTNVEGLLTNPAIVERAHLEQTERSALIDPLSSLYNRRHFVSTLSLELRRSQRYGLHLSVLMLDLDDFKCLNDERGHLFGDLVLQHVGHVLRQTVREADSACRYGGDEFAVILPETDRLGAYALAERVCRRVEERFRSKPLRGQVAGVRVSGGIAAFPEDGGDPAALVDAADRALYLSKSRGKNRISVYHAERRSAIRYPARPRSRFAVGAGPDHTPLQVEVVNLSRTGALLVADRACAEGAEVQLRCGAADGQSSLWERQARVVRVERAVRGCRFAIAFDEPLNERTLESQVRRERSSRPARPAGP